MPEVPDEYLRFLWRRQFGNFSTPPDVAARIPIQYLRNDYDMLSIEQEVAAMREQQRKAASNKQPVQ